jgi:hypothetical protein
MIMMVFEAMRTRNCESPALWLPRPWVPGRLPVLVSNLKAATVTRGARAGPWAGRAAPDPTAARSGHGPSHGVRHSRPGRWAG